MNKAFTQGTPSLFCISSPLQLLCAMNAITEYEIKEYDIIYICSSSDKRKEQVLFMLAFYNLKFVLFEYTSLNILNLIKGGDVAKLNLCTKYKRIFIGDPYSENIKAIAYAFAEFGAKVISLDDGNSTIDALLNRKLYKLSKKMLLHKVLNLKYLLKGIVLDKYYYTVYADSVDTKKKVYKNNLSYVMSNYSVTAPDSSVFFIGTIGDVFSAAINIPLSLYYEKLSNALKRLCDENPASDFYYIAHGRDNDMLTRRIVEEAGFVYMKLDEAVECYLLKHEIYPKLVVGFTSSALFNLKLLYKNTEIFNYIIDEMSSEEYENVSKIYLKNGVKKVIL